MLDHIDAPMLSQIIVSRMRARISNAKKFFGRKVERYDQEKMTLLEKQTEYRTNLTEYLQELTINSDDSVDRRWNKANLHNPYNS